MVGWLVGWLAWFGLFVWLVGGLVGWRLGRTKVWDGFRVEGLASSQHPLLVGFRVGSRLAQAPGGFQAY